MTSTNRPLSPHLTIYKPQLTSMLSITHRGTGVFLSIGAVLLACWLLAVACGPDIYALLQTYMQTWYGQMALYAWVFSLYYHLCNGIRHLCWDMGLGLDIKTTYVSGYAVIVSSLLLTVITACINCLKAGAV